jgi:hypothetical protein
MIMECLGLSSSVENHAIEMSSADNIALLHDIWSGTSAAIWYKSHIQSLSTFRECSTILVYLLCVRCVHVYTSLHTLVDYFVGRTWSYIDINLHNWQWMNWMSRHPVKTDSAFTKCLFYIISKSALMFCSLMCIPWDINIARNTDLVLYQSF